jgi:hypothetical protein
VSNNTSASARYAFWIVQQAGSVDYTLDVGWHTALLSPLGTACGGFGADQDLVITLTAPAFYFAICATNTSEITATLLFDVL